MGCLKLDYYGSFEVHVRKGEASGEPNITQIFLSVDPLAEQTMTPYAYCNNNPINLIDPDGKAPYDHIFNASGKFVRDTGVGNAVKVEINGKLYSPSQLSTSEGSRRAMGKIGDYYAGKVGAAGTKVGAGKGSKDSDTSPAFTKGTTMYLNTNGGFGKALDNISDFKSVMKHENGHKEDNQKNPNFDSNLSTHADVYLGQFGDKSFGSTTDSFKLGTAGSFGNYLLNMDKSTDFGQNEILSKIETFNSTNKGGLQISGPMGNFAKGSLNLDIQYKGNTYPVPYEKIKE